MKNRKLLSSLRAHDTWSLVFKQSRISQLFINKENAAALRCHDRLAERPLSPEAPDVKPGVTLMHSLLKCHYQPHLSLSKHTPHKHPHTQTLSKQRGQVLPAAHRHVTLTTWPNQSKQTDIKPQVLLHGETKAASGLTFI